MAEPSVELVRRAQAGDETALTQLLLGQQNYIYSIAMSILHDPEEAADATQEAFLRLFRVLRSYRGETRFTTWLYRIVVNLCYDELRQRKRRPVSSGDEEALDAVPEESTWSDPEVGVTQGEDQDRVRAALQQIEDPYRLVLILFYFQELKYREISDITGIPLNTVKSHIHRGKMQLAELLAEPGDIDQGTSAKPPVNDTRGPQRSRARLPLAQMAGPVR